jgi:DNA-binding SARP family transcriptional activator
MREGFARGQATGQMICGWTYPQILDTLCPVALRAGIEVDYVRNLIRRLRIPPPEDDIRDWPWPIRIRALGGFAIELDGELLAFGRKVPKRTLMLLKFLVAHGGEASTSAATDALWPDEEGDAAGKAFGIALHRLRQLLGEADAVELQGGELRLNRRSVWVDALAFERALDAPGAAGPERMRRTSDALALYRGHLLPAEAAEPWSISARERLRARFVREALAYGRALETQGEFETAAAHYARSIDRDDLAEALYLGQIRCEIGMNRPAEGLAAYRRLERTLAAALGLRPSPAADALQRKLRQAVGNR